MKMESQDQLKKVNTKNCMYYYFDDVMKVEHINVNNDLLDGESDKNILVYNILYKFMDAKPMCVRFNKINGLIKFYNGIRYLKLTDSYYEVYYGINSRIYNGSFDRINYLISEKSGIADSINHNFARIRTGSYNYLHIEKSLTFHNVVILIKSVVNENKNNYFYIFLEKGWYKESNTQYF